MRARAPIRRGLRLGELCRSAGDFSHMRARAPIRRGLRQSRGPGLFVLLGAVNYARARPDQKGTETGA